MRILVTGSRDWPDGNIIAYALESFVPLTIPGKDVTIVTGRCSTGADRMAENYAVLNTDWVIEPHPADWVKYGKRAGFVRNAEMVKLGADFCLAFIKDNSKGATMTADLAEKSGIRTYRWFINSEGD